MRFLPPLAGIALGAVFLLAAAAKGGDMAAFAGQVEAHGIVSGWAAAAVAWVLVPVEALLGTALLVGFFRRAAAVATGGLLVFFIAVTGWAWWSGNTEGCGCFGSLAQRGPGQVIVEDLIFLALALVASLPWGARAAQAGAPRFLPLRGLIVALAGAGAIAYEIASPTLPIDDYVTALRPGRAVADLDLGDLGHASGAASDGAPQGAAAPPAEARLVALLDLGDGEIGRTVEALNGLASRPGMPRVVAFAAASEDERGVFFWTHGPLFELHEASAQSLRPLYRRLPRFFLAAGGRVLETWNDRVPTEAEVAAILPTDDNRPLRSDEE